MAIFAYLCQQVLHKIWKGGRVLKSWSKCSLQKIISQSSTEAMIKDMQGRYESFGENMCCKGLTLEGMPDLKVDIDW